MIKPAEPDEPQASAPEAGDEVASSTEATAARRWGGARGGRERRDRPWRAPRESG